MEDADPAPPSPLLALAEDADPAPPAPDDPEVAADEDAAAEALAALGPPLLVVVVLGPQTPARHTPKAHGVSSGACGWEQSPVAGAQAPVAWHASGTRQITGLLPAQTPLWQVSVLVQALPSLHDGPLKSLHVPSLSAPAAVEHASHGPAPHAVEQQTPSTQ